MYSERSETPSLAILNNAFCYLRSAELLERQNSQLELGAILCSSLSIELIFKSLSATSQLHNLKTIESDSFFYNGVTHKGPKAVHKYTELYNILSDELKNYLTRELGEIDFEGQSLTRLLEKYENTFVTWRYGFEKLNKQINITELLKLNRCLYAATQKLSHHKVM